jgi:hypothetical protein
MLFGRREHYIYLTSPKVTNGVVTEDNGLFSPLINATNISGVFYNAHYYCDRFVFRRANEKYAIKEMA